MDDLSRRARSLPQLAYLASALPVLGRDLAEALDELPLPAEALSQLRAVAESGRMTVRDFLRRRDLHRLVERRVDASDLLAGFQCWVERSSNPSPTTAEHAAAPRSLEPLLAAADIPDLASWNAGMLSPSMPRDLARHSLGALGRKRLPAAQERALSSALKKLGDRARAARSEAAQGPPLASTGRDRLDAFRRALEAMRGPLRAGWPAGLLEARARLSAEHDDLLVDLGIEGDQRQIARLAYNPYYPADESIEWGDDASPGDAPKRGRAGLPAGTLVMRKLPRWQSGLQLDCWCGREVACIHRAAALDILLQHTANPANATARLVERLMVPSWQRALDDLSALVPQDKESVPGTLSFLVRPHGVSAFFHVQSKRGPSKRGVAVDDSMSRYLTRLRGHDRKIAETWALAGGGARSYSHEPSPFFGDALLLLEGHPTVRLAAGGPVVPVRVERATVCVVETGDGVKVSVKAAGSEIARIEKGQAFPSSAGLVLLRPGKEEVLLVVVPAEVRRLMAAIGEHGASFPREALPGLVGVLPQLEAVTAVELPDDLKGEEQPSASRPVLRVAAAAAGLLLSLRSEPLAAGPLFVPGQGGPLSASFDGTRRRFARRDFERELAEASGVAADLGLELASASDPFSWPLEPGERSIEILRRIHHLAARGQAVEWSAPKATFTRAAVVGQLRLRIERKRDWFGLDGDLQIDDRRVGMAALLEAARARRRWVQLGPNEYAELSEELIGRLAPLSHLAGADKLPTLTLGTVPLVEELAKEVEGVEAVEGWRRLSERLAQAKEKPIPLPEGLVAELRDYQADGFRWLSRLAEWGAGACLADDMGLGKTVQVLALLLSRAALGPALVVAPSSVVHTWRVEAARFAPSLRLRLFHEGDRDLAACGKGDVVVVSWTLFARQAELFAGCRFATAVFDEAQAIKNAGTQRARAAHGLVADFAVALTGTPVENHVGEIWSLLRAVLPSLLGSEESFRLRFASATPDALKALAALVQPFILRRRKAEVARELPPRTEVDVLVPLSPEERALYDDVRLAAAGDLGSLTGEDHRFQVLAALTRLRLVACHPKIQEPHWTGPTSKLLRLLELVRGLAAGGHRALVFSQFTQHLALVTEALRAEGIAFSYLDGQVAMAERQRRVEAFQAGEGGDLFLISLKAGGTGLTITAADYVIHLDPWWNPAVEDQASDRAHRIGQTRPVTVYRLIAEGTIEQQILSLHREKRELVDALLSGTDRAGRLSTEELASLIRSS